MLVRIAWIISMCLLFFNRCSLLGSKRNSHTHVTLQGICLLRSQVLINSHGFVERSICCVRLTLGVQGVSARAAWRRLSVGGFGRHVQGTAEGDWSKMAHGFDFFLKLKKKDVECVCLFFIPQSKNNFPSNLSFWSYSSFFFLLMLNIPTKMDSNLVIVSLLP